MIDGLFAGANYTGLKQMMDATVLRHEAIASNLANVETPHYKRLDVNSNFATELSRAVGTKKIDDIRSVKPSIELDKNAVAQNRDGNSVQLENELMHLQRNMIAHRLQSQMITGTIKKLKMAMTGGRGGA